MVLKYFVVVGRAKPTKTNPDPKIYKIKVFAKNDVRAKSLFWYHLATFDRVKRANGQILAVHTVPESDPKRVKNFGFWLKYYSGTGIHNMYREYRDLTLCGAAQKLYNDMAGRHKAKKDAIHIIDCREISDHEVKRDKIKQFIEPNLKFKNPTKVPRAPTKRAFRVFTKKRLTTRMY
mmetsp:Transcript_7529/g.9355  ORF Transcript_7529/g.9355 Transcript_7529/m.9355 type:complete len:177 (+) Transcript_7529:99-629(+)